MAVIVDLPRLAKTIPLVVKMRGLKEVRIRLWIMTTLLRLAALISPLDLILWKQDGEPFLYYCEKCGRDFCNRRDSEWVTCPHCGHEQTGEGAQ